MPRFNVHLSFKNYRKASSALLFFYLSFCFAETYDPCVEDFEWRNLWVSIRLIWKSRVEKNGKVFCGNYVMARKLLKCCVKRENIKAPCTCCSRAIAYDFDWLCIVESIFCAAPLEKIAPFWGRFISLFFLVSWRFSPPSSFTRIFCDNQMMELKPRIIRHHNL